MMKDIYKKNFADCESQAFGDYYEGPAIVVTAAAEPITTDYSDYLTANPIQDFTSALPSLGENFNIPIEGDVSSVSAMASNAGQASKPSAAQNFNTAASTIASVVSSLAPVVLGISHVGAPIVQPNSTNQLMAAMLAAGYTQQQALSAAAASLSANGINPNGVQVRAQLQSGLLAALTPQDKTWLIVGAVGIGLILLLKRG